jgi:uncharacterized protein (TIGR02680 family)
LIDMDDLIAPVEIVPGRPALPEPTRLRWQPLRVGLIELFHYDSEEFWFRDGHLLLRGNNGTGKSKVLALTLPFLLDAQLRPSRIEPDGDPDKRMAWNLLMQSYERRVGYAWIEFGRRTEHGLPRYLTLGAGLSAVAARNDVDSWFFIVEGDESGPRLGADLSLIGKHRTVLTRERLREEIAGRGGQTFETAASYRRAVDDRLFRLGPKRYDALIDTLIQLRQPQLSRRPDESRLSIALTEALPPLAIELVGDVAEALNQLEDDRRQIEEFQQLSQAVDRFDQRYRFYAGILTRRQARELRQSQTDFDNASRERNDALAKLVEAKDIELQCQGAYTQADLALAGGRTRLETLQSDPTMQDANRLEQRQQDMKRRQDDAQTLAETQRRTGERLAREDHAVEQCVTHAREVEEELGAARLDCASGAKEVGLTAPMGEHPFNRLEPIPLSEMPAGDFEAAQGALRRMLAARREEVALVRRRQTVFADAMAVTERRRQAMSDKQQELDVAARRRAEADAAVEREGVALIEAWDTYSAGLRQLRGDMAVPLSALREWVATPDGDNPVQLILQALQQQAALRLASLQHEIDIEGAGLRDERAALEAERDAVAAGKDGVPPMPYTRSADARCDRPGAPLWQLIDFRDHVDALSRAGIEAAIEASGLLDAWVTPAGSLETPEGRVLRYDSQVVARARVTTASLADWLCASVAATNPVPAAFVDLLLAGIAGGEDDPGDVEAWVSPAGQFRLGTLAGRWAKPQAVYIGFAARAAARANRLDEIAVRLKELAELQTLLDARSEALAQDRRQADEEWRAMPSDTPLRQAGLAVRLAAVAFTEAKQRLDQAATAWREAEQSAATARLTLERDAADLNLPAAPDVLTAVESALGRLNDSHYRLAQAVREYRRAWPDLLRQRARAVEAREELKRSDEQLADARRQAEEARNRFEVLREAVGVKVDSLREQLAAARGAADAAEKALKKASENLRRAGESRAIAGKDAEAASTLLDQRNEARANAVMRLQRFAESGLLSSALPGIEVPDTRVAWTIDPALGLARRAEQTLAQVKDDDGTWTRTQRHIAEDLQELQRALSALGHQAQSEPSDWGFIVRIIYQNRPERPDVLVARLGEEIAERGELLTAREREVLENHLQAEIAAEIQRLLQSAEKQLLAVNKELHKRPTSTGVRYRLQWLPLTEEQGAPVGLEAARRKLLNTSADLWSAEDRRAIGLMLQQRITAERERAEVASNRDGGGTLIDQLARALDYRQWHQFRVQRFQDGQWRKLSGPASSGERALGLTVPLFAAVSSFYGQSTYQHAPRLILLDEAFVGIDDAARAHCMGLIREFDLDFVMTSEREWACYAELPGVSICHLQRREGIDAVHVSRWTWDGRAKRREEDPDRRFASS